MTQEVITRTGLSRLVYTLVNSTKGLIWMWKNEAAFQQELILFVPLSIWAISQYNFSQAAILICALLFVLFAELVNTAIETTINRIGKEFNPLSGLAKDIVSAAVLIAIFIAVVVWCVILCR